MYSNGVRTSNPFNMLRQSRPNSANNAMSKKSGQVPSTSTSNGKKKKRKSKKKAANGSTEPSTTNQTDLNDTSSPHVEPESKPLDAEPQSESDIPDAVSASSYSPPPTSTASASPDNNSKAPEVPLPRRLETAASHPDVEVALDGLMNWSQMYAGSETILSLFQSDALQMLFSNLLRSNKYSSTTAHTLQSLLAHILATAKSTSASSQHQRLATIFESSIANIIKATSSKKQVDLSSDVDEMAQYLAQLVIQARVSLSGIDHTSDEMSLSKKVLELDAELANAASMDGAVVGQGIRQSFERRDIRSDALELYATRLEKVDTLVERTNDDKKESKTFRFSGDEEKIDTNSDLQKQVDEIYSRRGQALEVLRQERQELQASQSVLEQRQEDLEKQLEQVKLKIEQTSARQSEVEKQISETTAAFDEENALFMERHKDTFQQEQRQRQRKVWTEQVVSLEQTLRQTAKAKGDVDALREKQTKSLRQEMEGVRRYFDSQIACVSFLTDRVQRTQEELEQMQGQGDSNTQQVASHVAEDVNCLNIFYARDMDVSMLIERTLDDDSHAEAVQSLDPQLVKEVRRLADHLQKLYEPLVTKELLSRPQAN